MNGFPFGDWQQDRPSRIVVGAGAYARALAQVLNGNLLAPQILDTDPELDLSAGYSLVLESIKEIFIVADENTGIAELVWRHDRVWRWIEKLTSDADFHQATVAIVCAADSTFEFDRDVADRLDATESDLFVWRRSLPLSNLLNGLSEIEPIDAAIARRRRENQPKRIALVALRNAVCDGGESEIVTAVQAVLREFERDQHSLDSFCKPPCHQNGSAWRAWLSDAGTGSVTQNCKTRAMKLASTLNV